MYNIEEIKNTIICGDCLEEMKKIPDNSIDSIVTDPPAGINFMGKTWDTFDKKMFGRKGNEGKNDLKVKKNFNILPRYTNTDLFAFQDFIYQVFSEAIRVLKPGGYALVWAIPRTSHHTAMGIERAGFEIRDKIYFVFGCLSEDTEILTIEGWKHFQKDIVNYPVLCYDVDNDDFEFYKPTKLYFYENKYPAYRIQSNNTDQIVSRNHRVLIEQGGKFIFQRAEELQSEENIPFLESLPDLSEAISNFYKRTGSEKQNLFKRVYEKENWNRKYGKIQKAGISLSLLWKNFQTKKSELQTKILFKKLSGKSKYKSFITFLFKRERKEKSTKESLGFYKSSVERWNNLFQKTRELFTNKIYQMSDRIFGYGTERWLCYGTSINSSTKNRQTIIKNGSNSSPQSQSPRQQNRKFNDISIKQRTQNIRITRAKITETEYEGNVWCVEVPTGAFVARRNGKIFITGNSGFPKSLNISKAIEATEKYGKSGTKTLKQIEQDGNGEKYILNGRNNGILGEKKVWERKTYIPKGIAKQYEGWGTALKPAVEEWILARKPLSEKTVAQNVLKWETGGLNIDGCRIPCNNKTKFPEGVYSTDTPVGKIRNDLRTADSNPMSRFPSHLILDGSEEVEQCFPNQKSGKRSSEYKIGNDKGEMFNHGIYGKYKAKKYEDIPASEGSASRFFQHCPLTEEDLEYNRIFYGSKASKAERNFGLEGFEKKVGKIIHNRRCKICHHQEVSGSPCRCENPDWEILSKERKAFNNHPTVKPISLMRYLCRLITPKNGIVLDPFLGSGTTAIACVLEGFNFIGIEKEKEYCKIAEARIKAIKIDNTLPLQYE